MLQVRSGAGGAVRQPARRRAIGAAPARSLAPLHRARILARAVSGARPVPASCRQRLVALRRAAALRRRRRARLVLLPPPLCAALALDLVLRGRPSRALLLAGLAAPLAPPVVALARHALAAAARGNRVHPVRVAAGASRLATAPPPALGHRLPRLWRRSREQLRLPRPLRRLLRLDHGQCLRRLARLARRVILVVADVTLGVAPAAALVLLLPARRAAPRAGGPPAAAAAAVICRPLRCRLRRRRSDGGCCPPVRVRAALRAAATRRGGCARRRGLRRAAAAGVVGGVLNDRSPLLLDLLLRLFSRGVRVLALLLLALRPLRRGELLEQLALRPLRLLRLELLALLPKRGAHGAQHQPREQRDHRALRSHQGAHRLLAQQPLAEEGEGLGRVRQRAANVQVQRREGAHEEQHLLRRHLRAEVERGHLLVRHVELKASLDGEQPLQRLAVVARGGRAGDEGAHGAARWHLRSRRLPLGGRVPVRRQRGGGAEREGVAVEAEEAVRRHLEQLGAVDARGGGLGERADLAERVRPREARCDARVGDARGLVREDVEQLRRQRRLGRQGHRLALALLLPPRVARLGGGCGRELQHRLAQVGDGHAAERRPLLGRDVLPKLVQRVGVYGELVLGARITASPATRHVAKQRQQTAALEAHIPLALVGRVRAAQHQQLADRVAVLRDLLRIFVGQPQDNLDQQRPSLRVRALVEAAVLRDARHLRRRVALLQHRADLLDHRILRQPGRAELAPPRRRVLEVVHRVAELAEGEASVAAQHVQRLHLPVLAAERRLVQHPLRHGERVARVGREHLFARLQLLVVAQRALHGARLLPLAALGRGGGGRDQRVRGVQKRELEGRPRGQRRVHKGVPLLPASAALKALVPHRALPHLVREGVGRLGGVHAVDVDLAGSPGRAVLLQ
mmetsp:Transcript_26878/g.81215  ORF Transcript_26878/g.81215 Transcript_26878/m.81215 type:complete len:915 (+) Transcript_26878:704-3448(+)